MRVLFLADSHIGFDMPLRPGTGRRRRGPDFLANHALALAPALAGEADVVIHGGDVFDRPDVPADLAWRAYAPMLRVAERGVPVFIVPGNHERSRLPHAHLLAHANVHVFDRPRTYVAEAGGVRLALSGFPYEREVRSAFTRLVEQTSWQDVAADVRLLCVHHCIEGATVGPSDYTFTSNADVIRTSEVPVEFDALLSGHIHRHQVLTHDLRRRVLGTPVMYPGSVERTALAECGETKGWMMLTCDVAHPRVQWEFRELPARPMLVAELDGTVDVSIFRTALQRTIDAAPPDAVLTLRISGHMSEEHLQLLRAASLRTLVPPTMNLEVQPLERRAMQYGGRRPSPAAAPGSAAPRLQLDLGG